jgi:hypothetical protein
MKRGIADRFAVASKTRRVPLSVWARLIPFRHRSSARRSAVLIGLLAFVSLTLVSDAQARKVTEEVASGPTDAKLSYVKKRTRYGGSVFRLMRVRIERDGQALVDQGVPRRCRGFCGPARAYLDENSIRLRDTGADGEPEVIVDLYTGGAHCCFYTLVYGFDAQADRYRRDSELWNHPYRLRDFDHDGVLEFQTFDGRFDYAFACYACSVPPIQIWHFRGGHFSKVTRRFPRILARDAKRNYRRYRRARRLGKGFLATYVAEECLLHRCRRGFRVVNRAYRRGDLRRAGEFDVDPSGKRYIRVLRRFLRRTGYLH